VKAWPATTAGELTELLRARQERGYNVVFHRDDWVVLRSNER